MNWTDALLVRPLKTAVQVVGAEALAAAVTGGDLVTLRKLGIAAAAAFIAAAWNGVLAWSGR